MAAQVELSMLVVFGGQHPGAKRADKVVDAILSVRQVVFGLTRGSEAKLIYDRDLVAFSQLVEELGIHGN